MSRDFSRIKTSVWRSTKFNKLSEKHRLFYLYLLTCRHANSAGLFELHIGYMMVDLEWTEQEIKNALSEVVKVGLINYDYLDYTLYLHGWFDVNPPNSPKHAIKIVSDTLSVRDGKLKIACIEDLKRFLDGRGWTLNEKMRDELDRVSRLGDTITITETITYNAIGEEPPPEVPLFSEIGKSETAPPDNIQIALDMYNETAQKINIPMCKKLSDTRRKSLKARLKKDPDLTDWKTVMSNLAASPHCRGQNDRGWKADFDFVIRENSYQKILEGSYSKTINGASLDVSKSFKDMTKDERLAAGYVYDSETFEWTDKDGDLVL